MSLLFITYQNKYQIIFKIKKKLIKIKKFQYEPLILLNYILPMKLDKFIIIILLSYKKCGVLIFLSFFYLLNVL